MNHPQTTIQLFHSNLENGKKEVSVPVGEHVYWAHKFLCAGVNYAITNGGRESLPYLGFVRQPDTAQAMRELTGVVI